MSIFHAAVNNKESTMFTDKKNMPGLTIIRSVVM